MKSISPHSLKKAIEQRFALLTPQAQQLPPLGSRPVTVAGRVAGWVGARPAQCLARLAGVNLDEEVLRIDTCASQRLSLNQVLERIAHCLNDNNFVRSWRNELLAVIGEGQELAAIERGAVRALGFLTQAVHLNGWSSDGRIWAAKRAASKSSDPNMWDTLVGGLAVANESLDTSLLRESYEEAGLEESMLLAREPMHIVLRMHRRLPEGYQVENALVSDCVLADGVVPRNMDGEVSEFRLLDMDEWWSMIEAEQFTLEAQLVMMDSVKRRLEQA